MSKNGQLTNAELTAVDGVRLANATARAWQALADTAKREADLDLHIAKPHGGYRDIVAQQALASGTSPSNPASKVPIARPGFSTHGLGTRVDISTFIGKRHDWILANAHRFGFRREFGKKDPNHFIHDRGTFASFGPVIVIPVQEDTMSQAEVTEIRSHVTAEMNRVLDGVRRESRPRLFRSDPAKGGDASIMAIRMETGYVREFKTPQSLEVLKLLGLVAEEDALNVDPETYAGIKNETNAERARMIDAIVAAIRSEPTPPPPGE